MSAPLHIGIVATEFPPTFGGMQQLALELAHALSVTDRVTVYAPKNAELGAASFSVRPILSNSPRKNARLLAAEAVDVWLLLNAGLIGGATLLQRPVVAYVHGNDFLSPWVRDRARISFVKGFFLDLVGARKIYGAQRAIRAGLSAVDRVIANSHMTAAQFRRLFPTAAPRLCVIWPGVGEPFFAAVPSRERTPTLSLLTVARLDKKSTRKNIHGVLRGLAQLKDTLPFHYTVAGDGDDRPRLEALANELGIGDRVTFLGYVAQPQLPALYRQADLFVMASLRGRHDFESFGIVFVEALASGTPILCSRDAGVVEILDGESAIIVDTGTPAAIARALTDFASQRARFSATRLREIAERHRWKQVASHIRAELSEVLRVRAARDTARS